MLTKTTRAALGASLAFGLITHAAFAGGLTPPGAPAPTMKALDVVEPRIPVGPLTTPGDADSVFRITQPGSYYLTASALGQAGKHGVEIASSNVSLNLMGFTLEGVPGALSGVFASTTSTAVRVENGAIRNWGNDGVGLANASRVILQGLISENNGARGVITGSESLVVECVAAGNGGAGVQTAFSSTIRDSIARDNAGDGVDTNSMCQVIAVTAYDNGGHGIDVASGCRVSDSVAYFNALDGITGSTGIQVVNCIASTNAGVGIDVVGSSTVRGNTVHANTLDGIVVSNNCRVIDNTITFGGNGAGAGAGILITNTDNHIEGNLIIDSDIGVRATFSSSLIIRNTLKRNAVAFDLASGNSVGAIVSTTTSGVVSGTAGAAGVGTTDPWANLVY